MSLTLLFAFLATVLSLLMFYIITTSCVVCPWEVYPVDYMMFSCYVLECYWLLPVGWWLYVKICSIFNIFISIVSWLICRCVLVIVQVWQPLVIERNKWCALFLVGFTFLECGLKRQNIDRKGWTKTIYCNCYYKVFVFK